MPYRFPRSSAPSSSTVTISTFPTTRSIVGLETVQQNNRMVCSGSNAVSCGEPSWSEAENVYDANVVAERSRRESIGSRCRGLVAPRSTWHRKSASQLRCLRNLRIQRPYTLPRPRYASGSSRPWVRSTKQRACNFYFGPVAVRMCAKSASSPYRQLHDCEPAWHEVWQRHFGPKCDVWYCILSLSCVDADSALN